MKALLVVGRSMHYTTYSSLVFMTKFTTRILHIAALSSAVFLATAVYTNAVSPVLSLHIDNPTSNNALTVIQSADVGKSRSSSGAILLDNTKNNHTGLTIYSNAGSSVEQPLVRLEVDNEDWKEEILYIHSDSPTSRGLIRLDSPAPEIEYVETDQTGGDGKFETRVQHGLFQINSRNASDDSFENAFTFTPYKGGAFFGIADQRPDAGLEIVQTSPDNPLMYLSSEQNADGDILAIDNNGNVIIKKGKLEVASGQEAIFNGGINITGGCIALDGACVDFGSHNNTSVERQTTNSFTAIPVSESAPESYECNFHSEKGRVELANGKLYVCSGPEGWSVFEPVR